MSKRLVPIYGNQSDLARLLAISQQRVSQLAKDGILHKQPEGNFLLPEAIADYYAFKYAPDEEVDYMEEKAKHEAAKRALAELELAQRKGELHRSEDVELVMSDMLSNLRAQLLGLPTKLAPILDGLDKEAIAETLRTEIENRLSELSDYSPNLFTARKTADETEDD